MLIALDYDLTYSADPDGWDAVVALMRARGHEFVCVTGRAKPPGEPVVLLDGSRGEVRERVPPMPVVCSPDAYKRRSATKAGYLVDVWIDDCPGSVEPGAMVGWD